MTDNLEMLIIDEIISQNQEREGWHITDDSGADWAIDKIKNIKSEYNRKEMVAKNKIAQIEMWLQKEKEETERQIAFFEAKLKEYFDTLPEQYLKITKTQKQYKLPSGTLKIKYRQPEFIRNDEKLVAWMETGGMNDFVKIKKIPKWEELKKRVRVEGNKVIFVETGEIIDGVEVQEREPEFVVEVE
jgi:phage host-nuclease inhibitor protein Gam